MENPPQNQIQALGSAQNPSRRSYRWEVVLDFVRTGMHGSTHPAFDTTKPVSAIYPTGSNELGVAVQTSQLRGYDDNQSYVYCHIDDHYRGVSNVRTPEAPL